MAKFWAVFKREYLERVRTKSFIILTLFGPLLFGALMIVPAVIAAKQARGARIGNIELLDATGVALGNDVRRILIATPVDTTQPPVDSGSIRVKAVTPVTLAAAESTALLAVMEKRLSGYVVLDSATVAGSSARYAGDKASALGQMERLERAIRQAVLRKRLMGEGLDPARITALTQVNLSLERERIGKQGREGSGSGVASTVLGFVLAFLLYMSLILYGQNILRSVLEEKTTRVAEVIVASVRTDTLLAGKVLGVAAVGLTQQLVWAMSALLLYTSRATIFAKFGVPDASRVVLPSVSLGMALALLGFFFLGFIFYSSLFAAAGATVSSDQEAQQAAQPIMMLLVASIVFLNPILVDASSTLAKVLSWLPFSAPIVMPLRMSLVPIPAMEILLVLSGLALACAIAIWVSARIYRVGLLMYGKKPSFRELGRWIAQS